MRGRIGVLGLVFALMICSVSEARWFQIFRRGNCLTGNCSSPVQKSEPQVQKSEPQVQNQVQKVYTDQDACQRKANILASRRVLSHGVAPIIGFFEGIGCGGSPNCATCVPSRGMRLTGDAVARSPNGMYYRVRSWR